MRLATFDPEMVRRAGWWAYATVKTSPESCHAPIVAEFAL